MFAPPTKGQMYVTAALPPVPVIAAGVPGIVLVMANVLVTLVPLQPVTTSVLVPVVNVDAYFILTELPLFTALIPIVVALETDHANEETPVDVIE
jgi:hypothetical protein